MRDYARVAPQFWTGKTGRAIRALGSDVQLVALYLLTCPSANMIGLYYLALPTLSHETGIPFEGASKALRSLSKAGFAEYDEEAELIWIPEMARFQIAENLEPRDNRVKGIKRELQQYAESRFYGNFVDRYNGPFHLGLDKPLRSPSEAPPKPLRSQEQEQDQEQEQETGTGCVSSKPLLAMYSLSTPSLFAPSPPEAADSPPPSVAVWIPIVGKIPKSLKYGPVREEADGWEAGVTESRLAELSGLYPGVDVRRQLLRFRDWCIRKPRQRKTYSGYQNSIATWLDGEQNKSRNNGDGPGTLPSQQPGLTHDQIRRRSGAPSDWEEKLRKREESIVPWTPPRNPPPGT